jgi:hypothetical protein
MRLHDKIKSSRENRTRLKRAQGASRDKFLEVLRGYDAKTDANAAEARGLHDYTDHVEKAIQHLLNDQSSTGSPEVIFGPSNSQTQRVDQILDMCAKLVESLDSLTSRTSFDELFAKIISQYEVTKKLNQKEKDLLLKIVSACVGWMSTLYVTPQITPQTAPALARVISGKNTSAKQGGDMDASKRPIGGLLLASGLIPIVCGSTPALSASNLHLTTTKLNFASLHQGLVDSPSNG